MWCSSAGLTLVRCGDQTPVICACAHDKMCAVGSIAGIMCPRGTQPTTTWARPRPAHRPRSGRGPGSALRHSTPAQSGAIQQLKSSRRWPRYSCGRSPPPKPVSRPSFGRVSPGVRSIHPHRWYLYRWIECIPGVTWRDMTVWKPGLWGLRVINMGRTRARAAGQAQFSENCNRYPRYPRGCRLGIPSCSSRAVLCCTSYPFVTQTFVCVSYPPQENEGGWNYFAYVKS